MSLTIEKTTTNKRAEKVREAKSALDDHLRELAEQMKQGKSEALLRYLDVSAKFHHYSFGNIMLALWQRPDMTRIAGIRTWNRLGRHVRAGEHGIMILAPITGKRKNERGRAKDGEAEESAVSEPENGEDSPNGHAPEAAARRERVRLFKVVYVFDEAQTEGAELPEILCATGDAGSALQSLKEAVRHLGIMLEEVDQIPGHPSAHGVSCGGKIMIRKDLDSHEGLRVLAHELAHEILHFPKTETSKASRDDGKEPNKTIRETEADATAYVVCRHFGVMCDSADYLLLYDAEPRILLERLETIRHTAQRIIEAIGESGTAVGRDSTSATHEASLGG
ncbi:hypothetical protein HYR69_04735 [Candidatus Sumerlaeota bacterium]|nr:hypothetical protein [Candidatus Sumerlaeota bacterium]